MRDTADISDLLRHSAWMRRLAIGLARDEVAADDLVQEGWLAALEAPPTANRPIRPWLGEVLRNARRMALRVDARRLKRETASTVLPLTVPTADELVGAAELARLLAEELLALEASDREVLLLCYFEGLTSAESGARLGLPAGTVRWRLKQALERLRLRLDRREGGRRAWLAALSPLFAAVPRTVTIHVSFATGALAMKVGALTAAAATAVFGVWLLTQPLHAELAGSQPARASVASTSAPTAAPAQTPPPPPASAAAPSSTGLGAAQTITPETRRALLAQISAALAAARTLPARSATALEPALDKNYIQTQMKETIQPLVKECYERALRTQPSLAGRLTLAYSIVGDPSVGGLVGESHIVDDKSTIGDADLRECVQESMYAARFPPPRSGGEVRVEYPYTFAATSDKEESAGK